jgi:hypothetical protein
MEGAVGEQQFDTQPMREELWLPSKQNEDLQISEFTLPMKMIKQHMTFQTL